MLTDDRWLAVKQIVSDALDLPAEKRAEFLQQRCPDALRTDAEQLLRSCERISSTTTFLDTPAAQFAASIIASAEQPPVDLVALQAELAGRYTIERELGRGGMATVFLAHDQRHGRRVALKVVHSSPLPNDGSGAARFQCEIEIAARLTHPHILPLHDSGTTAAGLYYVMPFVPGESLREHLARSGPLSLHDALRILRDVASALVYAHRQGIVHRDIKPGNILLNQEGDALIADFGIASALAATRTDDLVFATPAYSAPEQLSGEATLDHRADLYSFGVMAYEMLAGARPFTGRSTQELLAAQQSQMPESLTTRRPDVSRALATLIKQLLARDPADRSQDTTAVLRALDAVINPVETKGSEPQRKLPLRTRMVGVVGAMFLMVGFIGGLLFWATSHPERNRCDTSNAEAQRAYTRGLTLITGRDLQGAVDHFKTATELDSSYACAWAGLAEAYTRLARFSGQERDAVFSKAQVAAEHALALDSSLVEGLAVRAHQLILECRWDDAKKLFARALALDSTYALARTYYGLYLHAMSRHDSAIAHLHAARNLDASAAGGENLLGRVFVNIGQPDSAIRYLEEARAFDATIDRTHEQLAHAYLLKGKNPEAIESMRQAAQILWSDSAQLAYIYARTGNDVVARRIVQRLIKTESERQLPAPGMAMAYAALGDMDKAFRWLENSECFPLLDVSAGFESIRKDSRYADLRRRNGFRSLDNQSTSASPHR